jgi:uncharacterized protein (TIGR02145 family)
VQLLTATANLAGVCAYASNYPPVGKYTSATEISFNLTPGYDLVFVGGTTAHTESNPYTVPSGSTVQSFTDKTGAPGVLVSATYTLSGSDGCAGAGVTLTLSGSQLGWRYQLYKGGTAIGNVVDGTGSTLAFPDAPAAGNFSYTVWTVDNSAVTAQRAMQVSNVRTITVNALLAAPTITASAATVCQNGTLRFTVPYAANTTYTWTASAGTSSSNSHTFNTSTTGAKTATVQLTVLASGTTCQSGNAATVTAVVATMPAAATVTRVSAATVCQGTNVVFRASGTAGSTYTWLGTAGTASGTDNGTLTVSGTATGSKSISAYARLTSSGTTCQSANAATVTAVVATMPATATVTRVSAATVCEGTNVVFRASGTAGSTYTWLGTAGTVSGTGNGTLTVSGSATGTKSVSAYARLTSSGTTCQSGNAATVTAVVATMPAAATVTRVSAATVCQGTNAVFRASGTAGSTYTWLGTAGTVSGTGNGTLTVSGSATGTKSVSAYASLASSGTTCQSSNAATVTAVVATMPAAATVTRVSAATVCEGTNVVFRASGTTGSTYTWLGTAGTVSGTGNGTLTVSGSATGTKSVSAYARLSSSGTTCQSGNAATVTAVVNPKPTITRVNSSGSATQAVTLGAAITAIVYTANNSAVISKTGGDFPTDVTAALSGTPPGNSYTISGTPAAAGTYGYSLTAVANSCSSSAATGTITVIAGIHQLQGSCTYTAPAVVGTFASFEAGGSTYVSIRDERDNKVYPVVKLGGRWIMARNLNYQGTSGTNTLTWYAESKSPSSVSGSGSATIGSFWCPGTSGTTTSNRANCDVWGALYSWETAMMVDGKWSDDNRNSSSWANPSASTGDYLSLNGGRGTKPHGICPLNWHVPTDAEWADILDAMEGSGTAHRGSGAGWKGSYAGYYGKSACNCPSAASCEGDNGEYASTSWYGGSSSKPGDDKYGFRVLPAGRRNGGGSGYGPRGSSAWFWSSSAQNDVYAWDRRIDYDRPDVNRSYTNRSAGFSVRCIRDL